MTDYYDDIPPPTPSLSIDWELYASMLEDSDMSLHQQKELIETLWSIAVMFVDLGFDLNPIAQICGEADKGLAGDVPDLIDLFHDHSEHQEQEASWINTP